MKPEKEDMKPEKEEKKKQDGADNRQIETPAPPQVLDPSRPPGSGQHETYRKEDKEKPRGSSPGKDKHKQ